MLDGLFYIASADGFIHEAELDYLKHVSDIFGFDEARFEQIAAQHVVLDTGVDPYIVLGLMPGADRAEVRRVYRSLVAEHHPDRLIAKGVPEELIDVATARMQAINQAYNQIIKLPPPRTARLTRRGNRPHIAPRQLTGWPHPQRVRKVRAPSKYGDG